MVSTSAAFLLGMINLFRVHSISISRRKPDWECSVVLLVCMTAYFLFGLAVSPKNPLYTSIYNAAIDPWGAAMYSLLAFYLLSASYRAFRMKTRDAAILLVAGLVGIIGNAPIGAYISHWLPDAMNWLTLVVNTSVMRAVTIGTSLGAYAAMVRVLLGIERSYLGGRGE
jgi:hypothetical protein